MAQGPLTVLGRGVKSHRMLCSPSRAPQQTRPLAQFQGERGDGQSRPEAGPRPEAEPPAEPRPDPLTRGCGMAPSSGWFVMRQILKLPPVSTEKLRDSPRDTQLLGSVRTSLSGSSSSAWQGWGAVAVSPQDSSRTWGSDLLGVKGRVRGLGGQRCPNHPSEQSPETPVHGPGPGRAPGS